jgi:hypothetical protein
MARELPPQLYELAQRQRGVLSCAQLLGLGLTKDLIASRHRQGNWQRVYPGAYAVFSGEVSREAALWGAVLYAGRGAALSHQAAAELWGLADTPGPRTHVTVPGDRRVNRKPGLVLHLSARALDAVHPSRNPPRTRLEETVIDLWETADSLDNAVGRVTRAIGRRLTTQDKLRYAMEARKRVRRRPRAQVPAACSRWCQAKAEVSVSDAI